jgi:hypothetical protein
MPFDGCLVEACLPLSLSLYVLIMVRGILYCDILGYPHCNNYWTLPGHYQEIKPLVSIYTYVSDLKFYHNKKADCFRASDFITNILQQDMAYFIQISPGYYLLL